MRTISNWTIMKYFVIVLLFNFYTYTGNDKKNMRREKISWHKNLNISNWTLNYLDEISIFSYAELQDKKCWLRSCCHFGGYLKSWCWKIVLNLWINKNTRLNFNFLGNDLKVFTNVIIKFLKIIRNWKEIKLTQ